MILQSLVQYYEILKQQGKVTEPGWCTAKVSYALDIGKNGELKGVIPLKREEKRGKKTVEVPITLRVPRMESRSSGVKANFLCDNSKYFLGIDEKGCGKRIQECFESSKEKHLKILQAVHGEFAEAVKNFFTNWNPEDAQNDVHIQPIWDDLTAGGNLIFCMGRNYAHDDEEIRSVWAEQNLVSENNQKGICMVTGEKTQIERIHTTIKGVQGAQSSGAALVSFNAPAFESYGKEQSYNAPVGKYAAFAYTTALNYLLSQRKYVYVFGDTTIIFWAESGEEEYQEAFSFSFEPEEDNQEMLEGVFQALKQGKAIDIEDIAINPSEKFYILGLAPNAARLSIRFFYQDSFGNILNNLKKHYDRMEIKRPSWDSTRYLGVSRILYETINKNAKEKKAQPNMVAGVFRAILSGARYPESLYTNTLIRIRAEQGVITRGRAAIIKAYLIRNKSILQEEDKFVGLNEEYNDVAYVLGRLFAVLEEIQENANPGINATIRDRYFNSACSSPASVFPVLMKLKNSHIRKLEVFKKIHYEKMLTDLQGRIEMKYPKKLNLDEQGKFILGYYHQVQKRYTKKEEQ